MPFAPYGPAAAPVTVQDVFGRIVGALEQAGIPYMLTGSFASSYHGMPRATQDIDIVIAANPDQLRTFANLLPAREYYVDLEEALEAHGRQTQFKVVDLSTGWKVDLIIRKSRAFSRTEFKRREPVELHGLRLYVATAEDSLWPSSSGRSLDNRSVRWRTLRGFSRFDPAGSITRTSRRGLGILILAGSGRPRARLTM